MVVAEKPRVLSLLGCYWPGNEATGPNQSFRAFASALSPEFDIRVIARDGSGRAPRGWQMEGPVPLKQLALGALGAKGLRRALTETPHDVLLLNGFHDREFTIPALILRRLGLIPRRPVILSPRGEFAAGALSLKSRPKRIYQRMARSLGLTRDVWLHATAAHERQDIQAIAIPCRGILEAPNARSLAPCPPHRRNPEDAPLRVCFLGRVAAVKNLHLALEVLAQVKTPVEFHILGPLVEPTYWNSCQAQIIALPPQIQVTHKGAIPHDQVAMTLAGYDLFFLPTKGENFGHAINEALAAGLPALISDATPWRGLEEVGAGWDLPLDALPRFAAAIDSFAALPAPQRAQMRNAARAFAERSLEESNAVDANRQMLLTALGHDLAGAA